MKSIYQSLSALLPVLLIGCADPLKNATIPPQEFKLFKVLPQAEPKDE